MDSDSNPMVRTKLVPSVNLSSVKSMFPNMVIPLIQSSSKLHFSTRLTEFSSLKKRLFNEEYCEIDTLQNAAAHVFVIQRYISPGGLLNVWFNDSPADSVAFPGSEET